MSETPMEDNLETIVGPDTTAVYLNGGHLTDIPTNKWSDYCERFESPEDRILKLIREDVQRL